MRCHQISDKAVNDQYRYYDDRDEPSASLFHRWYYTQKRKKVYNAPKGLPETGRGQERI